MTRNLMGPKASFLCIDITTSNDTNRAALTYVCLYLYKKFTSYVQESFVPLGGNETKSRGG